MDTSRDKNRGCRVQSDSVFGWMLHYTGVTVTRELAAASRRRAICRAKTRWTSREATVTHLVEILPRSKSKDEYHARARWGAATNLSRGVYSLKECEERLAMAWRNSLKSHLRGFSTENTLELSESEG